MLVPFLCAVYFGRMKLQPVISVAIKCLYGLLEIASIGNYWKLTIYLLLDKC
jgi:hypothetical protein